MKRRPAEEAPAETVSPDEIRLPDVMPVLPLIDMVVFPLAVVPLSVGQERSVRLVDQVMKGDRLLVLVRQKNDKRPGGPDDVHRVGVAATVVQMKRDSDGTIRLLVQGIARVRVVEFTSEEPFLEGRIQLAPEPLDDSLEIEGLTRSVKDLFKKWVESAPDVPDIVGQAADAIDDPRQLANIVAATVPLESGVRQELLESDSMRGRLARLVQLLQHEIAVRDLGAKITSQTQEQMSKAQKDYFLREQLRTIQKELGDEDPDAAVTKELREKLTKLALPDEARKEVDRELARLERLPSAAAEHGMLRNFLEWMAELPWGKTTETGIDVERARQVLEEDHYGLDKIKERIIEYLAVRKLRRDRGVKESVDGRQSEPILCFVGPPGVGKTSLGQSIARAMGRQFVRISLGGVHDESEIRGHRRTYIGAMPGRIVQALRRAGTSDPVFMLDEIDKVSASFQGDPAAALLEVLDPAQNSSFTDNYLGVPFDLSQVVFITTANTTATIAQPLLDRMEVIQLAGYIQEEKVAIATRYLVPRQRQSAGLAEGEIEIQDAALRRIIEEYTREAGVRNLDRVIANICRKAALRIAEGEERVVVTPEHVTEFLGPSKQPPSLAERIDRPGVATGLAWTPAGGDILFVEASVIPSRKPQVILTGSLGDVMRESAQAAISFVRSRIVELGLDPTALDDRDIHIHVPSGAIPKDGPSAGVTIVSALASAATGRLVRSDVAMTGEITLRGKVLPIGGIKEKALAAQRAGITTIILPRWNMVDVDEIRPELRKGLTFVPVETLDEVLEAALLPAASHELETQGA